MKQLERRKVIKLGAAFALIPSLADPARAAAGRNALGTGAITLPSQSMTYKREINRQLADGTWLSVKRSFIVQFANEAGGFRIDGKQTDVEVTAPPGLETLINIEKARVETGLFPLLLDEQGYIRSGSAEHEVRQIETALQHVSQRVITSTRSQNERRELEDFVAAVHQLGASLTTNLPVDLFAPAENQRSISREVALPDGITGEVTTTFAAKRDPRTNLMRQAERKIVTRLDGDARHTVECWSLVPTAA